MQVCLVYSAGELSLVEYGQHSILATCRTEHMSPYLISVQICPARGNVAEKKRMAYLVDKQTVKVMDLVIEAVLATLSHGTKIDWLVREQVKLLRCKALRCKTNLVACRHGSKFLLFHERLSEKVFCRKLVCLLYLVHQHKNPEGSERQEILRPSLLATLNNPCEAQNQSAICCRN